MRLIGGREAAGSVLLAAVLLGACGSGGGVADARRPIRVVIQPFLGYAPLLIARAEGYFEQEGLAVEFVSITRTEQALPSLLTGELDVLPGLAVSGMLTAMARGEPIRIVADKGYLARDGCDYLGIVVRPDLPFEQAAARMRRVAMTREAPSRYIQDLTFRSKGLELDSLEDVVLPDPVIAEALLEGSIDAAGVGEPWLTQVVRAGAGVLWVAGQHVLPDYQYSFLVYGNRLLNQDREAGVRFLTAFRRGVEAFNRGKTSRNLDILERETGLERALLEAACWPPVRADGRIDLASVMEYQRWAKDRGYIDVPASAEQLWDSSLVAASDTALRRYQH